MLKEFTSRTDIYADKSLVGDKNCSGLEGKYEMRRYRYDHIAKSIKKSGYPKFYLHRASWRTFDQKTLNQKSKNMRKE